MDAILGAIAEGLPDMIRQHGPTLIWALLATVGCVGLFLENRKLQKQVNDEIKAGIEMARGFEKTFNAAVEMIGSRTTRSRARRRVT